MLKNTGDFLELPKELGQAISFNRMLFHMKQPANPSYPYFQWLTKQLEMIDDANRCEINTTFFKQRQGAAQTIAQQLKFFNDSRDEVNRLEKLT